MKKGFLHIIEILIITMVMFIVILQFNYVPEMPMNYDRTKLDLIGNDILFTLDEMGVNWLNKTQVQTEIDSILSGSNLVYDIELNNVIKTPLYVGCLCSDKEVESTKEILKPMVLNNQLIEFEVFKIEPPLSTNYAFYAPTLPVTYDVVIIYDYNLASDSLDFQYDYTQEIKKYLASGSGIVHVKDIDPQSLTGNNLMIYKHFFGIKPDNTAILSNQLITFTQDPTFNKVKKYFTHVPLYYEDFNITTELFDKITGQWNQDNGVYTTSGQESFSMLTQELPEVYTVKFEFSVTSKQSRLFWSPSYQDESSFIAAGYSSDMLVIGDQGILGSTYLASKPVNLNPGEKYTMMFEKVNNQVTVKVYNKDIFESISYSLPSIPQQSHGFLGNNTNTFASVDNVKFTLKQTSFNNFLNNQEKLTLSETFDQENLLLEDQGIPALTANEKFDVEIPGLATEFMSGRIVWLSDGLETPIKEQFIKSLIVWASGDVYHIIQSEIPNPSVIPFLKTVNEDMFQPIELKMKLGFVFK